MAYNTHQGALALTITGASNETPIRVTITHADLPVIWFADKSHILENGDQVVIADVDGNTAANGKWVIQRAAGPDPFQTESFYLIGSAGNGAFVNTGEPIVLRQVPKNRQNLTTRRAAKHWWNSGGGSSGAESWRTAVDGRFVNKSASITSVSQCVGFDIDAPQGAQVSLVSFMFAPRSGHSAAPSVLPYVAFNRINLDTGAIDEIVTEGLGSVTPGGSAASYEVLHTIDAAPPAPEVLDLSRYRYTATLVSERGTNALDGMTVFSGSYTFDSWFTEQR